MEIADNIGGSRLTCGTKTDNVKNASDEEDIIEPDIDVGTYDDIVDESENNNNVKDEKIKEEMETLNLKSTVTPHIPLFSGFLIDQLIGKK